MTITTKASIFKNLNVTGGVQLDFNRYTLIAYDNGHPFATSISILEPNNNQFYEVFKSTDYSSLTGNKRIHLHNQNLQFSLPIALEYRLLKQRNFSWHISTSIQPTILLYSQQYLLSSDLRNYVKDNSLVNRFNLSTGIETFLSYEKNGYAWQIGPQFKKQLFTTNTKLYGVEEKIYNLGIKIGVCKKIN